MSEDQEEQKVGWFGRLKRGLTRSSSKLTGGITDLFTKRRLDDEAIEDLEELLITADLGVATSAKLAADFASTRFNKEVTPEEVRSVLAEDIAELLEPVAKPLEVDRGHKPHVVLVCGVNGSGKTTTAGKLAAKLTGEGRKVLLGAADTFRAAAGEQLAIWAERSGAELVRHAEGADPASVAYDTTDAAIARKVDNVLIDTAGRLHTKKNLMEELKKVQRVIGKRLPDAPHEVLLVLDATTGQNGLQQAALFTEALKVTGIVLTKLDGTAKGGVIIGIQKQPGIPIKYNGVGEGVDDLQPFNPAEFVEALFA